jgi:hypothetical protein
MVACGRATGLPTSDVQEVDAWPIGDQGENLAAEVDVDHGSRARGRWEKTMDSGVLGGGNLAGMLDGGGRAGWRPAGSGFLGGGALGAAC